MILSPDMVPNLMLKSPMMASSWPKLSSSAAIDVSGRLGGKYTKARILLVDLILLQSKIKLSSFLKMLKD